MEGVKAPAVPVFSDAHGPVILEKGSTASWCGSRSQFPGVLARPAPCKCPGGNDNSGVSDKEGEACRA